MTTTEITDETRLTMLKHLAAGKNLDQVATITRLDRDLVLDTVATHGYPHSLDKGIELLTAKIDRDRNTIPDGRPLPATTRTPVGGRLRALIADDEAKHAARRAEDAQKAAARAEIARLEKQLVDAKAKLRGAKPTATTIEVDSSVSSAELRAWAKTKGIDVPAVGRVPAAVREQYAAEHPDEAA